MKPFSSLLITLTSLITFNVPVFSQSITPANDGTGTMVDSQGNQYNITGGSASGDGSNLFHSFSEFGLDNGQIANFLTNPQIQNVLSRVVGGNPSVINGLIQLSGSNANLFLINPSGIVFGQGASLNVPASFTATTATGISFNNGWFNVLGTADYSNLVGNPTGFGFSHNQPGIILNTADLRVSAGHKLTLAGGLVINNGNLSAAGGNINIIAVEGGNWVKITPQGSLLSVEVPIPQDGQGNFQNLTVADLPTLLTTIPSSESGVAINSSGEAILSQTNTVIPTKGGTGIVSGNLNADGLNNSDGGNVIIYGNDRLEFYGFASARGGLNGGDGGFVEVSGKNTLVFPSLSQQINLAAPNGVAGTLLIDPNDITIVPGDGNGIPSSPAQADILFAIDVSNFLDNSNLIIQTDAVATSGNGDITLQGDASLNWDSGNSLTFNAARNLTLNGSITGNGALTLNSSGVTLINNLIQVDSLVTDVEGTTQLNSNVTTIGDQTYNDSVILLQDTSLSGNGLTFNSTIDSDGTPRSLTLTATGATNIINSGIDFFDNVGGNSPLRELITNTSSSSFGATFILDNLSIITTEDQDYSNSRVQISANQQQSLPITATFTADSDNNGTGDFIAHNIDGSGQNLSISAANVDVSGTIDLEGFSGGGSSPFFNGGNLDITATTGNIASTLIITRGDFLSGDPPNLASNGGNVTLSAENGNIQVYYIDARGQRDGIGGTVNITTGNFFRAIGIIEQLAPNDPNPTQSIYTAGGAGGGSITIRHGGNGVTPFIVGDATTNGTNGTLDSGSSNIDSGSFLYTTVVGNISIISVDEPPVVEPPVVEPPVVEPPVVEPPVVEPPVVEPPVVEPLEVHQLK
jgi:filamentous hemagglutinin family protein